MWRLEVPIECMYTNSMQNSVENFLRPLYALHMSDVSPTAASVRGSLPEQLLPSLPRRLVERRERGEFRRRELAIAVDVGRADRFDQCAHACDVFGRDLIAGGQERASDTLYSV